MAEQLRERAPRAHAQPRSPRRAPQPNDPDLQLFPFLTDSFIDMLTGEQAKRWTELAMPDCVLATMRVRCTVAERRATVRFLRDFVKLRGMLALFPGFGLSTETSIITILASFKRRTTVVAPAVQ